LSLTCQHRQNHVAAGDARLQRLGAGGLDRGQAMIEHVLVARTAFSTKPSNGPRNSIKCARSSWNTSQIMLHSRLGAEQLVTQIADLILNPAVGPTYAAFGHGSAQPQPAAGVQATGSIKWCEHICKKRRLYCRALPMKIASTAVFMLS